MKVAVTSILILGMLASLVYCDSDPRRHPNPNPNRHPRPWSPQPPGGTRPNRPRPWTRPHNRTDDGPDDDLDEDGSGDGGGGMHTGNTTDMMSTTGRPGSAAGQNDSTDDLDEGHTYYQKVIVPIIISTAIISTLLLIIIILLLVRRRSSNQPRNKKCDGVRRESELHEYQAIPAKLIPACSSTSVYDIPEIYPSSKYIGLIEKSGKPEDSYDLPDIQYYAVTIDSEDTSHLPAPTVAPPPRPTEVHTAAGQIKHNTTVRSNGSGVTTVVNDDDPEYTGIPEYDSSEYNGIPEYNSSEHCAIPENSGNEPALDADNPEYTGIPELPASNSDKPPLDRYQSGGDDDGIDEGIGDEDVAQPDAVYHVLYSESQEENGEDNAPKKTEENQ